MFGKTRNWNKYFNACKKERIETIFDISMILNVGKLVMKEISKNKQSFLKFSAGNRGIRGNEEYFCAIERPKMEKFDKSVLDSYDF